MSTLLVYHPEILGLTLNEDSFQFNERHYPQTHGTGMVAMGTKTAVCFVNIFLAKTKPSQNLQPFRNAKLTMPFPCGT